MTKSKSEWEELIFKLGTVFKPTSPVNREDLFAGRTIQIREVVDVINQSGQHAVLYGERGVGKTSLANMIFPKLQAIGLPKIAPHINCVHNDSYTSIWKRVFNEILFIVKQQGFELSESSSEILAAYTEAYADAISPDIVRSVLHQLGQDYLVVAILDEFDTVEVAGARRTLADTLKFLSDRNVPATVVLIGVGNDVESLVENHRSVERCLSQIQMPRMSRDELEEIIFNGLEACRMTIAKEALHEISRISRGLPHYTHLLGLHAGRAALDGHRQEVGLEHVATAMRTAITKAQATIQADYSRATASARKDANYRHVLLAAAMAETDDLGLFYAKDVQKPLKDIMKKNIRIDQYTRHLHAFCEDGKGKVLRKEDVGNRPRYRFTNPLLEPYVVMKGLAEQLITEEDLRQTRDVNDPQGRIF